MKRQQSIFPGWPAKAGLLVLLMLAVVGCWGRSARTYATGTVTGKVTYKGTPVPEGTVTFYGEKADEFASAPLGPDGTYEAPNVPVGPVKVTVTTPASTAGIAKAAKSAPGGKRFGVGNPIVVPKNVVSVPPKYSNPAQSGLTFTVHEGKQTYDIPLK